MCHQPPGTAHSSVVLLVTDNTLSPILNPSEVSQLFSMPLAAFLHAHPSLIPGWHYGLSSRTSPFIPPSQAASQSAASTADRVSSAPHFAQVARRTQPISIPAPPIVEYADGEGRRGGKDGRYYQYRDVPWGAGIVRMHQFLTGKEDSGVKPVYGLTS